ncbi:MAG TPA: glycosyltransferase [Mycobacteriales bacterium]|nr:glycosyltransferase [Mycobacteriales bacterium]
MRVLLASTSGNGHFRPLLPFARALTRAGHEIACAAPVEATSMVEREGMQHLPFDGVPGDHPDRLAVLQSMPTLPPHEARVLFCSTVFGRLNTSFALPGARAAVEAFGPDLVLHESAELSVRIAAEAAGVPQVAVSPTLTNPVFVTSAASGIAELRAGLGLAPDASGAQMLGAPTVSAFPASFDHPEAVEHDVHRFRDPALQLVEARGDLVYVTLGSEAHSFPFFREVLREAVAGALVAGLPVVVSTGADVGDDVLAGLEGDVRVEPWVDQSQVLAQSRVVVCHGGSGSTLGALAVGVPLVIVPLFADQPDNADRVTATGTGSRVDPGPDLAARVGSAVRELAAAKPSGSQRIAAEIAALPPVDEAVSWLEAMAVRR